MTTRFAAILVVALSSAAFSVGCDSAPDTGDNPVVDTGALPDVTINPAELPDFDFDGLPDEIEVTLGTDPENPDTDGDELSDGDEYYGIGLLEGFSPTDPNVDDTDGDGACDGDEAKAGTNPNDQDDVPVAIHVDDPPELTPEQIQASCDPHAWIANEWACPGFHNDPFMVKTKGRLLDGKAACHLKSDVVFVEWTPVIGIDKIDEADGSLSHNFGTDEAPDIVNCSIKD